MNRVAPLLLAAALLLLALPVPAQQQPPEDPRIGSYKWLLGEANDRVATLGGQVSALEARVKDLAKQLEDEKAKASPADKPKP